MYRKLTLITIPMSHYCEKARWALERAGLPYSESRHVAAYHYVHSLSRAGSFTVPVLLTETTKLCDSTDILKWVDQQISEEQRLYPKDPDLKKEVEEYEDQLDEVFGQAGRIWMYTYMLNQVDILLKYAALHDVPKFEVKLISGLFRMLRPFINHRLKMDKDSRGHSKLVVDRVFADVEKRLNGSKFLFSDRFSAADLTFAALAAPAIIPERYGVLLPKLSEFHPEMADQVRAWRAHPAGIFANRLYEEFRTPNNLT